MGDGDVDGCSWDSGGCDGDIDGEGDGGGDDGYGWDSAEYAPEADTAWRERRVEDEVDDDIMHGESDGDMDDDEDEGDEGDDGGAHSSDEDFIASSGSDSGSMLGDEGSSYEDDIGEAN